MSIHPVQCLASVDFKGQGIVCTFAIAHLGCLCGFRNGCAERRRKDETYVHPIVTPLVVCSAWVLDGGNGALVVWLCRPKGRCFLRWLGCGKPASRRYCRKPTYFCILPLLSPSVVAWVVFVCLHMHTLDICKLNMQATCVHLYVPLGVFVIIERG